MAASAIGARTQMRRRSRLAVCQELPEEKFFGENYLAKYFRRNKFSRQKFGADSAKISAAKNIFRRQKFRRRFGKNSAKIFSPEFFGKFRQIRRRFGKFSAIGKFRRRFGKFAAKARRRPEVRTSQFRRVGGGGARATRRPGD